MRKIKLTKGKYALVDSADFRWLSQWRWQYNIGGYAYKSLNKKTKIYMHQLINQTTEGLYTDHINRDKLDNRRSNLRTVTNMENGRNRGLNKNNKSGYKGVFWHERLNKWLVYIKTNYKRVYVGLYKNINDAVSARKQAEQLYWK